MCGFVGWVGWGVVCGCVGWVGVWGVWVCMAGVFGSEGRV